MKINPITKADLVLDVLKTRKGFDDWWENIDDDLQEEIKEEILKLSPRWIPVSERLPKDNTQCLGAILHKGKIDEYYLVTYFGDNDWGLPEYKAYHKRNRLRSPDVYIPLDALPEPEEKEEWDEDDNFIGDNFN